MDGWKFWHALTGIEYTPIHKPMHLPDADSRLQAVVSGNGIALLDELVKAEIDADLLTPLSGMWLENYDYYLIPSKSQSLSSAATFFEAWLRNQPFQFHTEKLPPNKFTTLILKLQVQGAWFVIQGVRSMALRLIAFSLTK